MYYKIQELRETQLATEKFLCLFNNKKHDISKKFEHFIPFGHMMLFYVPR